MRLPAIYSGLFAIGFSAVALTSCAGRVMPGTTSMAPVTNGVQPAKKKKSDLLYVADVGNSSVDVYSYPQGKPVQKLTGFNTPFGVCTDKKGNVFASDNYSQDVLEYAHGGSTPIATLTDINHNPAGCAVDTKTKNLAVVNEAGTSGPGGVSIYTNETNLSTSINGPSGFAGWYDAYDSSDNLFVDGLGGTPQATVLEELPKGASSFQQISLPVTIFGPGGVKWDGKHLLISDEQSTAYEFSISGKKATKVAAISLAGASGLYGFVLSGKDLVGAESVGSEVGVWKFPSGTTVQTIKGPNTPLDVAISK